MMVSDAFGRDFSSVEHGYGQNRFFSVKFFCLEMTYLTMRFYHYRNECPHLDVYDTEGDDGTDADTDGER